MRATLCTDGGARGNPGPAGIGYVLKIGTRAVRHGEYIGVATNNQAEYRALIAGLQRAKTEGATELSCFLDSELLVKQLLGEYRVRDADLRPLHGEARSLAERFQRVTFTHVPREKNKEADRLVNEAIDKGSKKQPRTT